MNTRTLRGIAGAAIAAGMLLAPAPVSAQPAGDRERCINADGAAPPPAVIAACTALSDAYGRGEIALPDAGSTSSLQNRMNRACGESLCHYPQADVIGNPAARR